MKVMETKIERRLRISGILIILGLFIELISLKWAHPTAFLLFVMVGGLLMAAGMVFYLFSLAMADRLGKEEKQSTIAPSAAQDSLAQPSN